MQQDNIVTQQSIQQQSTQPQLLNKQFSILVEKFYQHNWLLYKNEMDHIMFKNPITDYDFFEIELNKTNIFVTIPLKNSNYKYKTKFDSYFQACEFIEMHLDAFTSEQ